MKLKVLVIGLGSMGKRRIRNLRALKISDIYGFDKDQITQERVSKEYAIKTIESLDNLSEHKFDLAVISTPPQYHLGPISECIKNRLAFFSEYNLVTRDVLCIVREIKKTGVLGIPSTTEHYDSDILRLRKELSKKTFGYCLFHLGQNIHNWHPWQKPGEHFIFHPEVNGIRELLRAELPWLIDQFGQIVDLQAQEASLFTKKYKVPDYLQLQLVFESGLRGTLIFDLITPGVIKRFAAVGEKDSVIWEEREKQIKVLTGGKKRVVLLKSGQKLKGYKFEEDAFSIEMRQVIKTVTAHRKPYSTFSQEYKLLQLIDRIEKS
jgi:predicted dehydrogenase